MTAGTYNSTKRHGRRLNSPPSSPNITAMLKKEVKRKYHDVTLMNGDRNECIEQLKNDTDLINNMKMLAAVGEADIKCADGTLIRSCFNATCHEIMIVQFRYVEGKAEKTRRENYYKRIAQHDSKIPYSSLTREELEARLRETQKEKRKMDAQYRKLQKALEKEVNFDEKGLDASHDFLSAADFMTGELLKDKKSLRANLKQMLGKTMDALIGSSKEARKNPVVIDEAEKESMVDMLEDR